ncbi:MAG: hypothetical protein ACR2JC_02910 [Chloroflexota bacterium]
MRFTVVDTRGTVSFVGDGFLIYPLLAACSSNPTSTIEMLQRADQIDKRLRNHIMAGLFIFDEHNVDGDYTAIHQSLTLTNGSDEPVFRVVDELTRERSLEPTKTGLIIFNLKDRRIVEMLNHFYRIERSGEAHLHNGKRYSRRTVGYELPASWSIVP